MAATSSGNAGSPLAETVELAELVGAPVITEGVTSTCSFPLTHPLHAGSPRGHPAALQQLVYERAMFAPIYELAFVNDVSS